MSSREMLVHELTRKGVHDRKVLDAFIQIRREDFVPAERAADAYLDEPIQIGRGQVTTQPSLIASMVQTLGLTGSEKTLEIGSGLGFQTAILSKLCKRVVSIERFADLAAQAEANLTKAGIQNAQIIVGDGTLGLPDEAPFQAITVSAAAPEVPEPLIHQLDDNGRLVQPIGPGGNEVVTSFQKIGGELIKRDEVTLAYFVPLVGAFGLEQA